jgi:P27 family predicted phage terminase small subunit
MKPGPPPTPTKIKLLRVNPGKRALNANEPKPRSAIPSCPPHLNPVARKEWRRAIRELAALGLISNLDRAALAIYCEAYARWVFASDHIRKFGLIMKSPGGFPIQSPYLAILNKAIEQMRTFIVEFGMTPSSRSRVTIAKPPEEDEFEKFLNRGGIRLNGGRVRVPSDR